MVPQCRCFCERQCFKILEPTDLCILWINAVSIKGKIVWNKPLNLQFRFVFMNRGLHQAQLRPMLAGLFFTLALLVSAGVMDPEMGSPSSGLNVLSTVTTEGLASFKCFMKIEAAVDGITPATLCLDKCTETDADTSRLHLTHTFIISCVAAGLMDTVSKSWGTTLRVAWCRRPLRACCVAMVVNPELQRHRFNSGFSCNASIGFRVSAGSISKASEPSPAHSASVLKSSFVT